MAADARLRISQMCRFCVTDGVPRRSFVVAFVGTILNLINQGDALFEGGHVNIAKIILTYAVPYCVATYGAVKAGGRLSRASTNAFSTRCLAG